MRLFTSLARTDREVGGRRSFSKRRRRCGRCEDGLFEFHRTTCVPRPFANLARGPTGPRAPPPSRATDGGDCTCSRSCIGTPSIGRTWDPWVWANSRKDRGFHPGRCRWEPWGPLVQGRPDSMSGSLGRDPPPRHPGMERPKGRGSLPRSGPSRTQARRGFAVLLGPKTDTCVVCSSPPLRSHRCTKRARIRRKKPMVKGGGGTPHIQKAKEQAPRAPAFT